MDGRGTCDDEVGGLVMQGVWAECDAKSAGGDAKRREEKMVWTKGGAGSGECGWGRGEEG